MEPDEPPCYPLCFRRPTCDPLLPPAKLFGSCAAAKSLICFWTPSRVPKLLPAIVRKRLIGFGHAVHIFLLLDRSAAAIGSVEQFIGQLLDHALFAALTAIGQKPANRQRSAAVIIHF